MVAPLGIGRTFCIYSCFSKLVKIFWCGNIAANDLIHAERPRNGPMEDIKRVIAGDDLVPFHVAVIDGAEQTSISAESTAARS